MATKLSLTRYQASDLPCGHDTIWGGLVVAADGQHAVPLDCATCQSRANAMDELRTFAIYATLLPAETGQRFQPAAPRVMKAGGGQAA